MSFNVAAEAYDRFMGVWSAQLSRQLADLAGVERPQRVLDVGSGPGALTTELVARVGADHVAAVDPSDSFVTAARERHPGVDVRQASAEILPFPDQTFDAALAQLVVHFMTDAVAGLSEMARVVRSGGVVAACVWDFHGDRGPLGPFWQAARAIDPEIADESRLPGARKGHLLELFGAARLRNVVATELPVRRSYAGFDAWWEPFTLGVGPGGRVVASMTDDQRRRLRDRCRSMLPDGPFELAAIAWAARGVVRGV
ncbi:MAG TPA: methyltransferase domain-containing protein [Candidatus Limnocylindrales bacterium]|nr:methyltransferase domain-containing protein [Candidatus Limnocylindrales bacterium]